jgi:hypothetical protein
MADTQEVSPATLLDQLASLDPPERREVAAIVRRLSRTWPRCRTARQPHTCWAYSLTCSTRREPDGLCRKSGR